MERFFEFAGNHWILVAIFLALLAALFLLEGRRSGRKVSPQEAVQQLNRDAMVVVDIRERKEFSNGHIKGSLHIPMASLKERSAELKKHEGKEILVVDKAGQHSGAAVKQLQADGYIRRFGLVAVLKNGRAPIYRLTA